MTEHILALLMTSSRLLGLLPNMIDTMKVRQLVVGEVIENAYSKLITDQIRHPLQSKRKGCRRNKRKRLSLPWCLVKDKAGLIEVDGFGVSVRALLLLGVLILAPKSLFWHWHWLTPIKCDTARSCLQVCVRACWRGRFVWAILNIELKFVNT